MNNLNNLVTKDEIQEDLHLLSNSYTDHITKEGKVFRIQQNGEYREISKTISNTNGYYYIRIKNKNNKLISCRFHRLVALTFIHNPEPEKFDIVGHKNNIKTDCRIENLYWTNTQENTIKAVEDGLLINKKGFDNNDSKPVKVTDLLNKTVAVYGSMREAARNIENLEIGYLSAMLRRKNKEYTPRNKNYKYFNITKKEYLLTDEKYKSIHLIEKVPSNKNPKKFKAINLETKEEFYSDNQKKFAKEHNLDQAKISDRLLNPHKNFQYCGWEFILLGEVSYKEGTAYENQFCSNDKIIAKNIHTMETLKFKTIKETKDYFGLKGNDFQQYLKGKSLLFSKWKLELME